VCAAAGVGAAALEILAGRPDLALPLYILAYITGGWETAREAVRALLRLRMDVDLLMLLAAAGAAVLGHWAEGVVLLFHFSLGNALEAFAFGRSRRSIDALVALRPAEASLLRGDGSEESVPLEAIRPGDRVRVRPGERMPVDGRVLAGLSYVDESTLTGEAVPVRKETGSDVFAGTLNGGGALDVEVTRAAEDTTLARVIRLVEEAREAKAPAQSWLERVEGRYAATVILAAGVAVVLPVGLLGWSFSEAFYRAMTLLVVASPCALVISIPATIVSAVSNGARRGILFKGGAHLDALAGVKVVAFDKTGTLTRGRPELAGFFHLYTLEPALAAGPGGDGAGVHYIRPRIPEEGFRGRCPGLYPEDEYFLRLVAGVESRSEHHLARAILDTVEALGLPIPTPTEFHAHPGQGVEGRVDGIPVYVGRRDWVEERTGRPVPRVLVDWVQEDSRVAATPVFVATDEGPVGALVVADRPREGVRDVVRRLHEQGVRHVVMLTGDHPEPARAIAEEVGIDRVLSELLPEEKSTALEALREELGPVAMVGDGVNDAPALAVADVGIALGAAGTDVALETADVVVMGDDLNGVPYALELSRRARRIVLQNLVFASGVLVVLVALALVGRMTLSLGVLGHEGSTIVVVFNGLRLLRRS